jgi:hypothetical protein
MSTQKSDIDFQGVFLPSEGDLLGLSSVSNEIASGLKLSTGPRNENGDVDRRLYSLRRFIELASEGQPGALEMLFVPSSQIVTQTSEWEEVLAIRQAFLSQEGIRPFLGFALAQANKATIKGDNLNKIESLIQALTLLVTQSHRSLIRDHLQLNENEAHLAGIPVEYTVNEYGFPQIKIAGRYFDPGILAKDFLKSLKHLSERYGTRVRKAAAEGYDYKSLSHAFRLICEAEEFLLSGKITFPRPERVTLLEIRQGLVDRDWFDFLSSEISRIETEVLPKSILPQKVNQQKLEDLCIRLHRGHLELGL